MDSPVVLITGAGRRIGHGIAGPLARAGYRLALHAHTSIERAEQRAEEIAADGFEAAAWQADLRDESQVSALVGGVCDRYGQIDALLHCAGLWKPAMLEDVSAADVREHFEVNTLAAFLCCQQTGLIMAGQPQGGSIVILGDWAIARPYRRYAAYFPSKGALPAMTRSLAIELAHRNRNVRVNAILPGPMLLSDDWGKEQRQAIIDETLMKREGSVEDIAHAALFLLRNEFVTGVCLPVDGGRTIYAASQYDG